MKNTFEKVWPGLTEADDDGQEVGGGDRSSLMDIGNPAMRKSLEVMQACFISSGHRASLTMFLTELLGMEELNEVIDKLHYFDLQYNDKYIDKYQAYLSYYKFDHPNELVRESAKKYFFPDRFRKDPSTFKAVQLDTAAAASAVVEKAIDPKETDTNWPVPSLIRPPSHRSPSNSSIPAARQTHQGVNSERHHFKAANVDAIFAEGRQAAGLKDEEGKK